ncbi:MAG TPA: hypothetical protein VKA06_01780 [Spirochaetia bacterium]|nr:hypothetical protein [Spirochaetia bacterium]
MKANERALAAMAYLLSVVGAAPVLLLGGDRRFARFHALQSLGIFLVALVALLAWIVVGWVLALAIPIVGPTLAAALFALVITLFIVLVVITFVGAVHALRGERKPVPLIGIGIIRLYVRLFGGGADNGPSK